MLYDLAALTAAFSVAVSNLISPSAIRHLGPIVFNCWRLGAALFALVALVTLRGGWNLPSKVHLLALVTSSTIGIVVGDSCIYAAMVRLGPRRTAVIYTTWAPFAALFGYFILGETLSLTKTIGIGLVMFGISLAITYRETQSSGTLEEIHGSLGAGILFGLLGSICAAGAVLIARPVMADGVDPAVAAAIRATVGLVGLLFLSQLPGFKAPDRINAAIALRSAASGLLGMGAGMTLVLFALSTRAPHPPNPPSEVGVVIIRRKLWL